jgi:hypothetical protein
MDKATGCCNKAKEFVESSSRICIYFFWNGAEASIRGMDWTSDSSLEELLQSRNQPSSHFNDWIYNSIYGIHRSQCTQHHADATPFATASTYVSLEDVDWNIMIPANVMKTRTQNVIATFLLHAKTSQDARDEVGSFGDYLKTLPDHIQ